MSWLSCINPFELIVLSTIVSILICDDRDAGELNVFGNAIVAIGSLVLLFAAQKEFVKSSTQTQTTSQVK